MTKDETDERWNGRTSSPPRHTALVWYRDVAMPLKVGSLCKFHHVYKFTVGSMKKRDRWTEADSRLRRSGCAVHGMAVGSS